MTSHIHDRRPPIANRTIPRAWASRPSQCPIPRAALPDPSRRYSELEGGETCGPMNEAGKWWKRNGGMLRYDRKRYNLIWKNVTRVYSRGCSTYWKCMVFRESNNPHLAFVMITNTHEYFSREWCFSPKARDYSSRTGRNSRTRQDRNLIARRSRSRCWSTQAYAIVFSTAQNETRFVIYHLGR